MATCSLSTLIQQACDNGFVAAANDVETYRALKLQLGCNISAGSSQTCVALSGDVPPTGDVTPDFVGQLYNQNNGEAFFYSTGLTNADWVQITTGACGLIWGPTPTTLAELNYTGVALDGNQTDYTFPTLTIVTGSIDFEEEPITSLAFPALVECGGGFTLALVESLTTVDLSAAETFGGGFVASDCTSLTTLDLSAAETFASEFNISGCTSLTTLDLSAATGFSGGTFNASDCTSLTTLDLSAAETFAVGFNISGCTSLTTLDLSAAETFTSGFDASGCISLTTLNLSALTTMDGDLVASGCTSLTSVLVPLAVFSDSATIDLSGCALDATSINLVLARCVASSLTSSTIDLSGGTNAAPTGQGITDKAALLIAGCDVATN